MALLHYKTRGMVSPNGKSKVYFCCHPADFSRYFETISDEILNKQDCAIWYRPSGEYERDNLFADLLQMQLFVVPVTTALLYSDNDIADEEIRFALDNHIPVLPLIQERELAERFNYVYGDLQFLENVSGDPTAISYNDKLEKYLEAVLIGDELAKKIRAAFDAYVFLSYRKKDRKYAQELMRLIHQNDFCRDIAIWYDEFLTPGEDFNDSIKAALQKSGLFVLTVTPSLLETVIDEQGNENENYIVRHEYPLARQEGKPILPVELVSTDREYLASKYEDIPLCADGHNAVNLSAALMDAVKKMAIKENDNSPEHNFFIGLAYLGGVDVEVDFEKAVSLITSAAEQELPEAIKKLVSMYRFGKGVNRDILKSVYWQQKLIEYYNSKLPVPGGDGTFLVLIQEMQYLASLHQKAGNVAEAKCTYTRIVDICHSNSQLSDEGKAELADAHQSLGSIEESSGNPECAQQYLFKCIQIRRNLPKTQNNSNALVNALCAIGDLCSSRFQISAAHQYYAEAQAQIDASPECQDDYWSIITRASVISSVGQLYEHEGKTTKAIDCYLQSAGLLEPFTKVDGANTAKNNLAATYLNISSAYEKQCKGRPAVQYGEQGVALLELLYEKDPTIFAAKQLSSGYRALAYAHRCNNAQKNGIVYHKKSIDVIESIMPACNDYSIRHCLAQRYIELGQCFSKADALMYYCKGREMLSELLTCAEDPELIYNYCFTTHLMVEEQTADIGLKTLLEALPLAEKLKETRSFRTYTLCGDYYYQIGEYCKDTKEKYEYFLKGIGVKEEIIHQSDTGIPYTQLALLYAGIGEVYSKMGMDGKALKYMFKGISCMVTKKYQRCDVDSLKGLESKMDASRNREQKRWVFSGFFSIIAGLVLLLLYIVFDIQITIKEVSYSIILMVLGAILITFGTVYYSKRK